MTSSIARFFVDTSITLKAAMRQLEETEERILFVTDEHGRLFGSITDGDIRRWILADGSLDGCIGEVCNRNPCTVPATFQSEDVRQAMLERNITCIPVLDDGRVVDLLFWSQIFQDQAEIRPRRQPIDVPVVIMAGGKGTRLDPFTRILPKPLIPIGDKAVIEIIIESFTEYGVTDFLISVNHKAKVIKSFFEELRPLYKVMYVDEDQPLGTAGGLRRLAGQVTGSLVVTNCDIIVRADYADLLQMHEREGNDITAVASMKSYNIPYGVCELGRGGRLNRIIEKPRYDFLVNTGMYVLHAKTLELIPENQMFHATDLIQAVIDHGGKVGVYP
ncbi:sugar phosphate nucleotidyltransferase, partial [Petrachloros mirabilis]